MKKKVSEKRVKKEQNILLEMRSLLMETKEHCIQAIKDKQEILKNSEGKVKELISAAEQIEMLKVIKKERKDTNIKTREQLKHTNKKIEKLQKKFDTI